METVKIKKENNEQVTFKDPEIFAALKKISENKGNTGIAPEAKELLREALKSLGKSKDQKLVNEVITEKESPKNDVITKESEISLSEKLDIIAESLGKLITAEETANEEFVEKRISEGIQSGIDESMINIMAENIMLQLPDYIRNLVYKLLEFKKGQKADYSESVEQLFLSMFKTYVDESSDSFPDGFKKEFNKQFKEYFTVKPVDQIEKEIEAKEEEVSTWSIGLF
jgi:hypothetical protein